MHAGGEANCWRKHPDKEPKWLKDKEKAKAAQAHDNDTDVESDKEQINAYIARCDPSTWIADSGCSKHMTGTKSKLYDLEPDATMIDIADNNSIRSEAKGKSIFVGK